MGPEAWAAKIGESGWAHLRKFLPPGNQGDLMLAEVLTAGNEIGFTAPEKPPKVVAGGTRVLWPTGSGGRVGVLTGTGLALEWAHKGHGFLLIRAQQLALACAGPLLGRLQEVLSAYEERCRAEEVDALPKWANIRPFVGGEHSAVDWGPMKEGLFNESPTPGPRTIARAR